MDFETLHLDDLGDGLWALVLDRPPANALSKQMAHELRVVASSLSGSAAVRALLVRGEGRVFFGGGDLAEMQAGGDETPANLHEMTIDFHGALSRLARLDAPVVGAITGTAGGAGMSMVAALDLVIAGESSRFTMGYTAAGLSPDGTSTFFLSRVVGLRRATELVLTNRMLSASEALEWGLVNQVVPDDRVIEEATALARRLAAGPTAAFGAAKRLLVAGAASPLEAAMEAESFAIGRQALHPEAVEGIDAFLNKRTPDFPH